MELIEIEDDEGIRLITLRDPARHNALTPEMAASGTGRMPLGDRGACCLTERLFETSVVSARSTSDRSGSIDPSSCRTSRPAAFAFCIAPRESPTRAAYWRSLIPFIGP